MSKTRAAIGRPVYRPRNWGRGTKSRPLAEPWFGLDTERDSVTAKFVCGFVHDGVREQKFTSLDELAPGTYWVYNLGYDIEALIADLGLDEGWAAKADGTPFVFNGAKAIYYHGKRFEYRKPDGLRLFLDVSPFYNKISLMDALNALCVCKCVGCKAGKHCGLDFAVCPAKDGVDASKMSLERYRTEVDYQRTVDRYCSKDALGALRLMRVLQDGLRRLSYPIEVGGTPGSTARRFLAHLPKFTDVCWTTHRAFLNAYCGGRFELTKRGGFHGDLREHDLVSAYPWALSQCPFLTETADNYFTTRLGDSPDIKYGAYLVSADMRDNYLGLLPTWKGTTRVYSAKEEKVWITRPELQLLAELGFDYKILRGVEIKDPNALDLFGADILDLFKTKTDKRKEPVGMGAKVVLNSEYGVLIQLIPKPGKWVEISELDDLTQATDFAGTLALVGGEKAFEGGQYYAPCYAATLTSLVRVALYRGCAKLGFDNVIATHTDSILSRGGSLDCSSALGGWELKETATDLVIGKTGQYAIGEKVKGRGIGKRKLNPLDEEEIAKRHREDLWALKHQKRSRVSIKTAQSWGEVSVIRPVLAANNVGVELKRNWDRELTPRMMQTGEWTDSQPLKGVGWQPKLMTD